MQIRGYIVENKEKILWLLTALLLITLAGGAGFFFWFKQTTEALQAQLRTEIGNLETTLTQIKGERDQFVVALNQEQHKNSLFEEQINSIAKTVGTLEKLSKTDEELLQKYSKVYFLNEHYMPEQLELLEGRLVYQSANEEQYIHPSVEPYLRRMIDDATENGIAVQIVSAFRSFDTQSSLKSRYLVTYGSGANSFSADQGYSEHQLGTTVDFTTKQLGSNFEQFGNTTAYEWLTNNAHRYGFTLSYPENNQFYEFEPWHWRFVGVELATRLYNEDDSFYDLDQRDIDTYLVKIFD